MPQSLITLGVNVIYYGWITYLAISGVRYVVRHHDWIEAYRHIQWRLYVAIIPLIALTAACALSLIALSPAIFGFSWISFVAHLLGRSANGTNINLAGMSIPFLGIGLCLLFFTQLPYAAEIEERWFRRGTRNWVNGVWRSLLFGLVHMLVGVPFGVALALGLGGLYFTHLYFKGGTKLSSQGHFQYNLVPLTILLIVTIVTTVRFVM